MRRRYDALNTPRQLIEAAILHGLHGLIITDHDCVKGGLEGKRFARNYAGFRVIPGVEVSSSAGHILAIGVKEDVPRGLGTDETVERIHDLGGIAVSSHPFSGKARSVKEECVKADIVEVFNAHNTPSANNLASMMAEKNSKPKSAGSDAHWSRVIGKAGVICDDPVEDLPKGRARIFGSYMSQWEIRQFQARQVLSIILGRPFE